MNVEEMRHRLGADEELIADVIRLFLEDYPERRGAIEGAIRSRDFENLRREAHSLKGSSSHLAAHGVMEAAGALEQAAQTEDLAAIESHFARLVTELEGLVIALRELLSGRS